MRLPQIYLLQAGLTGDFSPGRMNMRFRFFCAGNILLFDIFCDLAEVYFEEN